MLNLANLRSLLSQVLSVPSVNSVVLFTPQGQLISSASSPEIGKDRIRVVVGLSTEIWQETAEQGIGMVDCELGHLLVVPIATAKKEQQEAEDEPVMLLALTAEQDVPWDELEDKARKLAQHLEKPLGQLSNRLNTPPPPPVSPRGRGRR